METKQQKFQSNEEIKEQIEKCIDWIRDLVKTANCKGVLVGLSGGIDSAVVANLLVRAFPQNSLGVILPVSSSNEDSDHATKVAEKCKIKSIEIDLTEEKNSILYKTDKALKEFRAPGYGNRKLSDGNLRARLRMSTLYAIANEMNYLVVGTDNRAELYTGYFTKYGDGGVDILPLASLLKKEVYQWGEYFGVPEEIINKNPSAGLWDGQSDEEELGISYEKIDLYLMGNDIPEKDKLLLKKLHLSTEHKRKMPPIFELKND